MRRSLMLPALLLGFSACFIGPKTSKFGPATGPQGIAADLRLTVGRVQGELLEVQDTALLVLRDSQVVLVPFRVVEYGLFKGRGLLVYDGKVQQKSLPGLRQLSRFPAGLTPALRTQLLAAYGQTAPVLAPLAP